MPPVSEDMMIEVLCAVAPDVGHTRIQEVGGALCFEGSTGDRFPIGGAGARPPYIGIGGEMDLPLAASFDEAHERAVAIAEACGYIVGRIQPAADGGPRLRVTFAQGQPVVLEYAPGGGLRDVHVQV